MSVCRYERIKAVYLSYQVRLRAAAETQAAVRARHEGRGPVVAHPPVEPLSSFEDKKGYRGWLPGEKYVRDLLVDIMALPG